MNIIVLTFIISNSQGVNVNQNNRGCFSFIMQFLGIGESKFSFPYRVSDKFLSPAEYSFYMVLKKILADRFIICPQVPLSAIFFVTEKRNYMAAFNRIASKRIDFLICDGLTVKPLFGIELDDKSHNSKARKERDVFVEKTFEVAGLPLLRIPAKNVYVTSEIESTFAGILQSINWHPTQPGQVNPAPSSQNPVEIKETPPKCPKCGADMVLRVANSGPRKGEKFYGCTNYPNCRTIIPIKVEEKS